jgi:type II secretory pathway pseudopilin PulG
MQKNKGQLLLEILVVIGVMSMIIGLGSQMIIVSMRSSKAANERNVAIGLIEEIFESSRIIAAEKWQNISSANKGSDNHYHPQIHPASGGWGIASGDEQIAINGLVYTRYFFIDNVSRDPSTRNVEETYNILNDDPSTQKITAYVGWADGAETISFDEYLTRWMNKIACQTAWNGGGTLACPTASIGADDGNVDYDTNGSLKIKPL